LVSNGWIRAHERQCAIVLARNLPLRRGLPRTYEKINVIKILTPNFITKGSARCQNIFQWRTQKIRLAPEKSVQLKWTHNTNKWFFATQCCIGALLFNHALHCILNGYPKWSLLWSGNIHLVTNILAERVRINGKFHWLVWLVISQMISSW
jgi:nicotinamide riboside transporter PnuC